jgi:predicted PurR-regulated permease PerM
MSDQTKLPVCFIFIILLVGEHYLGVWGLLIGVPIFIFLLNAMEVDYRDISNKDKRRKKDPNPILRKEDEYEDRDFK